MADTDNDRNEALARLRGMTDPKQQTWDLSENDVGAIRFALREIERLSDALVRDRREDDMTTETKWTPKPWSVSQCCGAHIEVRAPLPEQCASRGPGWEAGTPWPMVEVLRMTTREEQVARAHLIAAAPDLYAVLERVEASMRDRRHSRQPHNARLHAAVAAVLRQARGEDPMEENHPSGLGKATLPAGGEP